MELATSPATAGSIGAVAAAVRCNKLAALEVAVRPDNPAAVVFARTRIRIQTTAESRARSARPGRRTQRRPATTELATSSAIPGTVGAVTSVHFWGRTRTAARATTCVVAAGSAWVGAVSAHPTVTTAVWQAAVP